MRVFVFLSLFVSQASFADYMVDCEGRAANGKDVKWSLWIRAKTVKEILSSRYDKMPLTRLTIDRKTYGAGPRVMSRSTVKLPVAYYADPEFQITYGAMIPSMSNAGLTVRGNIAWGSISANYYMTVPLPTDVKDQPVGKGKLEYFIGSSLAPVQAEGTCRSSLRILKEYWEGPNGSVPK